jgi:plastocyanin
MALAGSSDWPIGRRGSMNVRRLRVFLPLTVGFLFAIAPAAPAHAGGGGCHNPELADVAGTRVDLRDNCFVQTVLRVKPGQAVTWTNHDSTEHSVTGAGGTWGDYSTFLRGGSVTYRFGRPGVYPYFCYVHAGMVGAVVVGNGGKASSTQSSDAGVAAVYSPMPASSAASAVAPETETKRVSASSPDPWRTIALVTLGLLVAAAAGIAAQRIGLWRSHAETGVS